MIVEHLPQVKTKQEIPGDVYTYISPKVPRVVRLWAAPLRG